MLSYRTDHAIGQVGWQGLKCSATNDFRQQKRTAQRINKYFLNTLQYNHSLAPE
ncbi:hypothetical protein F9C07_12504 [Aspergillus flavus]|uniref:Uncharacterized protein n=1 Tax=Aspergillus flavus (strain ATCC 200026 / FGSC A1120 / IAM 13836 / NRRL 3357 / JCM 12722 / SRRC 167) TaxID=332952 RepID=A0A7U2MZ49_ASPFN|nr:hypothetical protein F9C07_12504 [Aspergillus flavus]